MAILRRRRRRPTYDRLRSEQAAEAGRRLPAAVERLTWDRGRIEELRVERLRAVLTAAADRSPWHRARLAGNDVASIDLDGLRSLPVMDKDELMGEFDRIATVPGVDRAGAEAHLERVMARGPAYYADTHHVVASGGTSGSRAVVVWDWDGWIEQFLLLVRRARWIDRHRPDLVTVRGRRVHARSRLPVHIGAATESCFALGTRDDTTTGVDVCLPIPDLVARLNDLRPGELYGLPSSLRLLAEEQNAGRLRLSLHQLLTTGEALIAEDRRIIENAFGCPLTDEYGASETGMLAGQFGGAGPLLVNDDAVVLEIVDEKDEPVLPGEPGDHVLVTNLINHVLPVVRYRLDDCIRQVHAGDSPWTATAIETVGPRALTPFRYGEVTCSRVRLEDVMLARGVSGWQVRQTPTGLDVDLAGPAASDQVGPVRDAYVDYLASQGLPDPTVSVRAVERIAPHPTSGKVVPYVPLRS
jgi:phenylacetate-coenzyme A ligase PaaK-like adenylate-forming protein